MVELFLQRISINIQKLSLIPRTILVVKDAYDYCISYRIDLQNKYSIGYLEIFIVAENRRKISYFGVEFNKKSIIFCEDRVKWNY